MCEFCAKHGQGNRWYLNPDNFSDEMMKDPQRVKTLEKVAGWAIEYYIDFTSRVTQLAGWPNSTPWPMSSYPATIPSW